MHAKLTALLAAVTAVYVPTAAFAQGLGYASGRTTSTAAARQVTGDPPPGVLLNLRQFEIPFSVDLGGSRPAHVELFVSRDQGQRWELFARQPASGRHFQFTAPDDGHYWFATRTIDVAGNPHPAGNQIAPQLHVTVDTARPQLSLKADVDAAGRVRVAYIYSDAAPSTEEVQLQYMTDADRTQWVPVAVTNHAATTHGDGTRRGEIEFLPEGNWRYLNVRLSALDQAGNQAAVVEQVERPRMARTPAQLASRFAPADSPAAAPQPSRSPQRSGVPQPNGTPQASGTASRSAAVRGDGGYAMQTPQPATPRSHAAGQDHRAAAGAAGAHAAGPRPAPPFPAAASSSAPPSLAAAAGPGPADAANSTGRARAVGPVANPYAGTYTAADPAATRYRGLADATAESPVPELPRSVHALPVSQPSSSSFAGGGNNSRQPPSLSGPALSGPAVASGEAVDRGADAVPAPWWSGPSGNPAAESVPPGNASYFSRPVPPSSAMRPISIETLPTPAGEPDREYPVGSAPAGPSAAGRFGGGYQTERPSMRPDLEENSPRYDSPSPAPQPPATTYVPAVPGPSYSGPSNQEPTVPGSSIPGATSSVPTVTIDESEIRQSRSRQFSLDYEVESVGSKGIDEVELWGSNDGGRTWSNWGSDPDRQSPFDIETVNSGLYGFCIVVVGGNGLTSRRPQPGDPADIYVRVDDSAPEVHLLAARYGEGDEAGSLVIEYDYEDENPVSRPVSLAFSDNPDGPWTTIATGLDATGRYAWPADPRLPRQIYLRIEGVDRAGNVGVQSRDTPVAVQGLAPKARIRGFQPITN